MRRNNKIKTLIVAVLLLVGFLVRLYGFGSPIADWHSWRQADTSSVSRNFVSNGFDLLHPRFDDLSNVPSGLDNPNGYRFVEFPIFNVFQAGGFVVFNTFTLEQWGRLISIFASLLSALFLFLLLNKRLGFLPAIFSMFFFLFLPFNVYYSRTILPDPLMVVASLSGIYFFEKALSKKNLLNLSFLISLILTAAAFLIKPYALFFTLPIVYLAFEKFGLNLFKKWQLWLFLIFSIIPLILWRTWIAQYPQGIPSNNWLFNGGNIRFKGSFFYWLFAERIGKLILGSWGIGLLVLGFLLKQKKENFLFALSFIISSLVYLCVMARGNVQHDYYQILIIPSIAIYLGLGSSFLLNNKDVLNKISSYLIFFVLTAFTLFFSWYFIRDFYNINNHSIVIAGEKIDKLIPKDAKIIANYNGDTSFLYQTKRKGWASFEKSIPEMVQMGASYLVLPNPTEKDLGLGKEYKIMTVTKDFVLFNLLEKP
jgi:hypothetical protein